MQMKRPKPVGLCSACGSYLLVSNAPLLGRPCRHEPDGQHRCRGVYVRPRGNGKWAPCEACEASGQKNADACRRCQGCGWYYLQDGVAY